MPNLAWGAKVTQTFCDRVVWIGEDLALDPSHLMACMAFESGQSFRADIYNAAGSGAVGLIQFMPQTAAALGTSTQALARMTAEDQLNYVWKYFEKWRDRLRSLADTYMAILWPAGVGKADDWNLFVKGGPRPSLYLQNRGLDIDKDGDVSKAEATKKVKAMYDLGLTPGHFRPY